jgi:hypothetical protein
MVVRTGLRQLTPVSILGNVMTPVSIFELA